MSSQVYTMKLVVDDSAVRALEARLNKIMGISGSGTASGSSSSSGTSTSPMANLGKLAKIATGIGLLVIAVQKIVEKVVSSSPALQAMLKILDMSITLILRPIGDFFAFFLKPLLIMFLRTVALPFYKMTAPLMRWLGTQAGNVAATNFSSNWEGLMGLLTGDWTKVDNAMNKARGDWLNFFVYVGDSPKKLMVLLTRLVDNVFSGFVKLLDNLSNSISNIKNTFINFLNKTKIPDWVLKLIDNSFSGFVKILDNLRDSVSNIKNIFINFLNNAKIPDWILKAITDFKTFFYSIKIDDWIIKIIDNFFGFIKKIGDWLAGLPAWILGIVTPNNTNTQNLNTGSNAQLNIYATLDQFGKDVSLNIDGAKKQVFDWFNSWMRS